MTLSTTAPAIPPAASAHPSRPPRRGRRGSAPSHRGDARLAWILIAPAAIGFLVFAVYPTLRGIYLSFTDFRRAERASMDRTARTSSRCSATSVFWDSLLVTVYFVIIAVALAR